MKKTLHESRSLSVIREAQRKKGHDFIGLDLIRSRKTL